MKRTVAILVQCSVLAQSVACMNTRLLPVQDPVTKTDTPITQEPGLEINGYVTSDGASHDFYGRVRLQGDEFLFQRTLKKRGDEPTVDKEMSFRLPRAEVVSFVQRDVSVGKTMLAGVGILIGVFALAILLSAEEFEFGP